MTVLLANNAVSELTNAIGITDTTIGVQSGDGALFPATIEASDWFPLTLIKKNTGEFEIVRCTAHAENDDTLKTGHRDS